MTLEAYTAAAPGKVLIAGGYLVLDPDKVGIVLSTSARVYATVLRSRPALGTGAVEVVSPQFGRQEALIYRDGQGIVLGGPNAMIEQAIEASLVYLRSQGPNSLGGDPPSLSLILLADNAFYSQLSKSSTHSLLRFDPFPEASLSDVPKTGLGSSAALVSSIIAAILGYFGRSDVSAIYRLSQMAHCRAQGKVGSGFDVAAACYGSMVYQRFNAQLMVDGSRGVLDILSDARWDSQKMMPVTLSSDLALLVLDCNSGSSRTPSLVRKVQAWRATHPDIAEPLWNDLNTLNEAVAQALQGGDHESLRRIFPEIRSGLRRLTQESGVPVEPNVQKQLLDDISSREGVIAAGVPGAGGFDAIFVLVLKDRVPALVANLPDGCSSLDVTYDPDAGLKCSRLTEWEDVEASERIREIVKQLGLGV